MEELCAGIGSDTAFFVANRPALATGRGEILEPVDFSLRGKRLLIVKPAESVSTSEAYAGIAPRRTDRPLLECLNAPVDRWRETVDVYKRQVVVLSFETLDRQLGQQSVQLDFRHLRQRLAATVGFASLEQAEIPLLQFAGATHRDGRHDRSVRPADDRVVVCHDMQDAAVVFAVDVVQVLAPVRSALVDRNGTADFRSLEGDPCIHRVDACLLYTSKHRKLEDRYSKVSRYA